MPILALKTRPDGHPGSNGSSTEAVLGMAYKSDVARVNAEVNTLRTRFNTLNSKVSSLELRMATIMFKIILKGVKPADISPGIEAELRKIGIHTDFGLERNLDGTLRPSPSAIQLRSDVSADVKVWGQEDEAKRKLAQLERIHDTKK